MSVSGKIAVQMMMLKDQVAELGCYPVLQRLREMGFGCVEVSQIPMTEANVADLERAIGTLGMQVAACSAAMEPPAPDAPGEFLTRDFDKLLADCKRLGCSYLRMGSMPMPAMTDLASLETFAALVQSMAERLGKEGVSLYFHNHHREFRRLGGRSVLDILAQAAPSLGLELDVHWIQHGGENPLEVIPRYAGRIDLLHLKDYRIDWEGVPDWSTPVVQFAEVGEGSLPMEAIIQAGLAGGSRYFIIEQDKSYNCTPWESLEISRRNLCQMGYSRWF